MHNPAVPELAHTRATAVHWVATAAALAAVVALAGFVQPDQATATVSEARPGSGRGPTPVVTAPDPAGIAYPFDCHGAPQKVSAATSGDLDGDGRPETVAVVGCEAGSGTPPDGVYVLTRGEAGEARVVATLLDPAERKNATGVAVRDGAVTATLLGYSSTEVPRCCPDEVLAAKWRWDGGKFLKEAAPDGSQGG
ncbi:hypothetical protein [Streptomyces sp. NPDC006879]|uniref:hypothetical protein n=1 Tax=Streptomyces sp. NPDC006879 TaxID=3364767 RepID=UPI00368991C3